MPTAQLAPPRPSSSTSALAPIDLSKETLSISEAARLLNCEENLVGLLCRKGVIVHHKKDGECRIELGSLMAHRRERNQIFKELENYPLNEVTDELIATGLYWKGDTNINTRLPK